MPIKSAKQHGQIKQNLHFFALASQVTGHAMLTAQLYAAIIVRNVCLACLTCLTCFTSFNDFF